MRLASWRNRQMVARYAAATGTDPAIAANRRLARSDRYQGPMARSNGVGRALATYRVPIESRDEWIAVVERLPERRALARRAFAAGDPAPDGHPSPDCPSRRPSARR
jgi:hypothetical protein